MVRRSTCEAAHGHCGGQLTGDQLQDRGSFGRPGWSMRQFSIAAFSSRGKVMAVRVLYAFVRPPVPGLGPRLRRAGTWVRISWQMVPESLLVGLCFIKYFINTKPNFALIVDRDVVMHHKI